MQKLISAAVLLLFVPLWAPAQNADPVYHFEGYGFVADEATVGAAGGGG